MSNIKKVKVSGVADSTFLASSGVFLASSGVLMIICVNGLFASPQQPSRSPSDSIARVTVKALASSLAVLPDVKAKSYPAIVDFGQLNALDTALLEHVFLLKNTTTRTLAINRVEGIGFSSLTIQEDKRHRELGSLFLPNSMERLNIFIAPGQTIHLKAVLDPSRYNPGAFQRPVQIVLAGPAASLTPLIFKGHILPAATLTPTKLDYGRAKAGSSISRLVTVRADARLFGSDRRPSLVAANPYVLVTPQEAVAPEAPSPASGKPKFVTRHYKITWSPQASLGPLTGDVFFVSTLNTASLTQRYGDAASLQGEVVGGMTAVPEAVDFGTVSIGTPSVRTVVLTFATPVSQDRLKVFCGFSPTFTARLLAPGGQVVTTSITPSVPKRSTPSVTSASPSVSNLTLEVTFTPDKPMMGFSQQVFVEVGTAERLVITASAKVAKS